MLFEYLYLYGIMALVVFVILMLFGVLLGDFSLKDFFQNYAFWLIFLVAIFGIIYLADLSSLIVA